MYRVEALVVITDALVAVTVGAPMDTYAWWILSVPLPAVTELFNVIALHVSERKASAEA